MQACLKKPGSLKGPSKSAGGPGPFGTLWSGITAQNLVINIAHISKDIEMMLQEDEIMKFAPRMAALLKIIDDQSSQILN